MSNALQISKTGMLVGNEKMNALAADMANANSVAGKNTEYFSTAISSSSRVNTGSRGVTGKLIQNISQSGDIKNVQNNLYCAAGDRGFFVVDDGFTRVGTWDFNKDGLCVNHLGQALKAYAVNPEGQKVDPLNPNNLITDQTTQTFLTEINKSGIRMDAKATENVNLGYQLPKDNAPPGEVVRTNLTVFDSFGVGHNVRYTFTKADTNLTNVALPGTNLGDASNRALSPGATDAWFLTVDSTADGVSNTVGAPYGTAPGMLIEFDNVGRPVNFNNQAAAGTPVAISQTAPNLDITWQNRAADSSIVLDLGAVGENNGVVVRGREPKVGDIAQDGHDSGQFLEMRWTTDGYGVVIFDNGQQERRFQLAMAHFASADNLEYGSDGVYKQTTASGQPIYGTPDDGIVGKLSPSAIEDANISEIKKQVDIIENQQYFGAQATVFRTAREMLEVINTLKS